MANVLIEEKKHYGFDCHRAVWASDDIHKAYHECGLTDILSDADFIIETADDILLVEYKNANIPEALAHTAPGKEYNPNSSDKFNKIVRKYYDSLHYLHILGKEKPIRYVFVLEYPRGDSASRKGLRNKLKRRLPFRLQERIGNDIKLIESIDVVNIEEWNDNQAYGQFPIKPLSCFEQEHS